MIPELRQLQRMMEKRERQKIPLADMPVVIGDTMKKHGEKRVK
jgi:hypothetical protein